MSKSIYKEKGTITERNQKREERREKEQELDILSKQLLNIIENGMPSKEVGNFEEYHCKIVRARNLLNEEDLSNSSILLKRIVEEIVKYITMEISKNESSNILDYHSNYDILFELSNIFYIKSYGTISDHLVMDLCNGKDNENIDRKCYLMKIYLCCTSYGKNLIEKEVRKDISKLSCKVIYYGVLSGFFAYNNEIENRLQEICQNTISGFDRVDLDNPIYIIIKLHIWGYIKNLSSYEKHLPKSKMLRFALKPNTYQAMDFCPEWWPLLQYNPYRNAILTNHYNKEMIMKKLIIIQNEINKKSLEQIMVQGFKDTIYSY